jgi:hypothetical protein
MTAKLGAASIEGRDLQLSLGGSIRGLNGAFMSNEGCAAEVSRAINSGAYNKSPLLQGISVWGKKWPRFTTRTAWC